MCKRHWGLLWLIVIGWTAAPARSGPEDGILGIYWGGYDSDAEAVLTRIDPGIDFDWGTDPPDPAPGIWGFSVRWVGELEAPSTDAYTLILRADGHAALWIDGKQMIDLAWRGEAPVETETTMDLTAGQIYQIEAEYHPGGDSSFVQLSWQSPSLLRQIIPAGALRLPLGAREPSPANEATEVLRLSLLGVAASSAAWRWLFFSIASTHRQGLRP